MITDRVNENQTKKGQQEHRDTQGKMNAFVLKI